MPENYDSSAQSEASVTNGARGKTPFADVVIAGGGPAGMLLGVLLARRGLTVEVLEKHADFLRDFRGDTVHPSTLQLFDDLGWLREFLALPHTELPELRARFDGREIVMADFSRLPVSAKYVAFMPQWDLLDFLARKGAAYPGFRLRMSTSVDALLARADGRVVGVRATSPEGRIDLRSRLVVGADGRHSTVRASAGLPLAAQQPAVDVLWFRVPTAATGPAPLFNIADEIVIMIDRGDYAQAAHVVPEGTADELKARGIDAWRERLEHAVPELRGHMSGVEWGDVHELRVRVDRLRRWHDEGVLCIGDAAHAMSPAGGVGINIAMQDAVATSNLLGPVLERGTPNGRALARVRRRRARPVAITQAVQIRLMNVLARRARGETKADEAPTFVTMLERISALRHLTGRFIGLGVQPERVDE